jgi:hypothetical protein
LRGVFWEVLVIWGKYDGFLGFNIGIVGVWIYD